MPAALLRAAGFVALGGAGFVAMPGMIPGGLEGVEPYWGAGALPGTHSFIPTASALQASAVRRSMG